jgi:hypothetical protein
LVVETAALVVVALVVISAIGSCSLNMLYARYECAGLKPREKLPSRKRDSDHFRCLPSVETLGYLLLSCCAGLAIREANIYATLTVAITFAGSLAAQSSGVVMLSGDSRPFKPRLVRRRVRGLFAACGREESPGESWIRRHRTTCVCRSTRMSEDLVLVCQQQRECDISVRIECSNSRPTKRSLHRAKSARNRMRRPGAFCLDLKRNTTDVIA